MRVSVLGPFCDLSASLSLWVFSPLSPFFSVFRSSLFFFFFFSTVSFTRSGNHSPLSLFIPLLAVTFSRSLSPTAAGVYNDSSWWDDTGSEVRTAEPDVHSMESLSSGTAVLRWLHVCTSLTLLARGKSAPFEQRTPAPAFARTRVAREQFAWKARAEDFSRPRRGYTKVLCGKLIQ